MNSNEVKNVVTEMLDKFRQEIRTMVQNEIANAITNMKSEIQETIKKKSVRH